MILYVRIIMEKYTVINFFHMGKLKNGLTKINYPQDFKFFEGINRRNKYLKLHSKNHLFLESDSKLVEKLNNQFFIVIKFKIDDDTPKSYEIDMDKTKKRKISRIFT